MTREAALLVTIGIVVVLLGLGVIAWRRRGRRDAGLAAPVGEIPAEATVFSTVSGLYVATTQHEQPLERLAIRGLGFRSRADLTVTDKGVALDIVGQPRLFFARSTLDGVRLATVAIDRVVEPGGLVQFTWRAGEIPVDTYFRPQDGSARALADAIADTLAAAGHATSAVKPTDISTPTSTTPTGADA